jgi:glutathione peroxidase
MISLKWIILLMAFVLLIVMGVRHLRASAAMPPLLVPPSIYEISINTLQGSPIALSQFRGSVLLFVNVASECGFTPQYAELEALHQQFNDQGVVIIGVPANNFGGQEPGSAAEIQSFCQKNYGVSFLMTEKISVSPPDQHPLYTFLTQSNPEARGNVKWNFEKILVNQEGTVVKRFSSFTNPMSSKIIKQLNRYATGTPSP